MIKFLIFLLLGTSAFATQPAAEVFAESVAEQGVFMSAAAVVAMGGGLIVFVLIWGANVAISGFKVSSGAYDDPYEDGACSKLDINDFS